MKPLKKAIPNIEHPDRILSYFRMEYGILLIITVSGIFYNIGLLAGPLFEGKLVQCLLNILNGKETFDAMLFLTVIYVSVIAAVQAARYIKRLYVRRFSNNVNRSMKHVLYGNLVHKETTVLEKENIGSVMTKAISDVDACAEGMRKFTTEIFDTGVALVCYIALLFFYDWRLTLLCLIFPPFSYLLAEKMKTIVQKSSAAYKESAGRLNAATLDRVSNALTYRVFGCEEKRDEAYRTHLADYEKKAVTANIWGAAMPPLYQIVSMISVLFILYFGAKNVSETGWTSWDIAAFTTYLSCFTKLSIKSSKAAKLFNSVHTAEISWKRIKPLMKPVSKDNELPLVPPAVFKAENLGFAYPDSTPIFTGLSFTAAPGQFIGVTGPVACGKSSLGKAFLCELPYLGSLRFAKAELSSMSPERLCATVSYLGHDPELISDSIKNNILLGEDGDILPCLKAVCMDEEVSRMPQGTDTLVGNGGIMLSGGQKARLALARTLYHKKPLLILDDPFSALDKKTEEEAFRNLKQLAKDSIVILISHRLYLFPEMDQVIWMADTKAQCSTHERLMEDNSAYANLYLTQCYGGSHHENE